MVSPFLFVKEQTKRLINKNKGSFAESSFVFMVLRTYPPCPLASRPYPPPPGLYQSGKARQIGSYEYEQFAPH